MITKDLGIVTAYGYAVSKGYTGTEEEFAELMASYATVAEQAAQSASTASEKAQQAAQAVLDAVAAKEAAVQAKNDAVDAKDAAVQSATNAASSATAASGSATNASQSAQAASDSASAAAQSATNASGSATAANTAKEAAVSAQGAAETAQGKAETAQGKAEEAQEAAEEAARTLTIDATLTQSGLAADAKAAGDKIADLKSDLNYDSNYLTFKSSDFVQGVWENGTGFAGWNKRITIPSLIPIRAGAKLVYNTSSLEISFGLFDFNGTNTVTEFHTWHTVSSQTEHTFLKDGLFFVQFRKSSGDVITPEEYDASCSLHYGVVHYLTHTANRLEEENEYIDNSVYGSQFGINYFTNRVVTTGASWSNRTIVDSIDLIGGYTYKVTLKSDRTFNVSGYARIYDSDGNELSVSTSANGKNELSWFYTPTQNYANANIKISYGSADSYKIFCLVESNNHIFDDLQQQMTTVSIPSSALRKGTIVNASNAYAVSTKVIKTQAKHIEIVNTRPNKPNCVYQYSIATITQPVNDLLESPSSYTGYTEIFYPYYSLAGGCSYGLQISVFEYNKTTNQYEALVPNDFDLYPLAVYEYNDIPIMYGDYMKARLNTIKNLDASIGNSGDSLIFITDQHQRPNDYISPYLAKHIIRNSSVKRLIYGGDYINTPNSKELALEQLNNAIDSDSVVDDAIFMQGNHETNPYGTGAISENELYGVLTRRIERFVNTGKNNYYYFDNKSQKIRYFVLNTGEEGNIDTEQTNWFKTNAESLDADWCIVILSHMAIYLETGTQRTEVLTHGVVYSIVSALENVSATICCWICGHCHVDIESTVYPFPIIAVTCDSDTQGTTFGDNRDAGTINRGAFDVFHIDTSAYKIYATRIGGGESNVISTGNLTDNDREWTYSAT